MAGPREALQRLRAAAEDDRLEALARRHRLRLLAAFGSATDPDWPAPHDLDIAIDFERDADVDLAQVILDLMDLVRFQEIDVLNLSRARANPLVRTSGLVGGAVDYQDSFDLAVSQGGSPDRGDRRVSSRRSARATCSCTST